MISWYYQINSFNCTNRAKYLGCWSN